MVPGLGLNAQRFGRIRLRRRGEAPSALARVHLTVRYLPYRTKKPPAFAEGLYIMVPGLGIEPRTRGFSILCSTN